MVQDLEVGLKRSATLPFILMEKVFMVMGEVYICLIPAPLPPIIHVVFLDHWFLIVMSIKEVDICLIPETFLRIIMVDYKLLTQGSLKNIFQGFCKEKIHIKIIIIILSMHITTLSSQHNTTSLFKHNTYILFVSILYFWSYVCTLCSPPSPLYTILRLST